MPSWRSLFIQRILDRVCQLAPFSLTYKFSSRMFMGLFWLSIHLFLVIFLLMQCEQQRHSFFPWQLFAVWAPAACSLHDRNHLRAPATVSVESASALPSCRNQSYVTDLCPYCENFGSAHGLFTRKTCRHPQIVAYPALTTSSGRVFEDKLHLHALIYTNGL